MDFIEIICKDLGIPKKYMKIPNPNRTDRILTVVRKHWITSLLKEGAVSEFVRHTGFSDDEVLAMLHQGTQFCGEWQKVLIQVIKKPSEEEVVVPLPRPRHNTSTYQEPGLPYAQLLHYISETNYKNIWKHFYKKHSNHQTNYLKREEYRTQSLVSSASVVEEVITRLYGCKVIQLSDMCSSIYKSTMKRAEFHAHSNILPVLCAVECESFMFLLFSINEVTTLKDCVTFSPVLLSGNSCFPLFIIYQLVQVMKDCHDRGLVLGEIQLDDIFISNTLFIQVIPSIKDNLYKVPSTETSSSKAEPKGVPKSQHWGLSRGVHDCSQSHSLQTVCTRWLQGQITNFEYLMFLNKLAGRRYGDPTCHYIMPWVSDLSTKSSGVWRDFSKSKFRLNKGDQQLDLTYENASHTNQVPHHVTDVLSEITYYVYLSRKTPRSILCKYVRANWVPAEYPTSIQRLQLWTPDECIPEFFSDPSIFKSIHEDLPDMELPPWALTPEEFIEAHRAALESRHVSERLHHWIDLTFGYKLAGAAAVKSKNVCLQLVDGHTGLRTAGVVQLFPYPHAPRQAHIPFFDKMPPKLCKPRRNRPHVEKAREQGSEEDVAQSSANEDDDSFGARSSPLVLSRLISRSRGSLLAPFQSSSDESSRGTEPNKSGSSNTVTPTINLPKEFNPSGLLSSVETVNNFFHKTYSSEPDMERKVDCGDGKSSLKQVVAGKRLQEMQILGCLLVEMLLNSKLRVADVTGLDRRVAACSLPSTLEQLPRCVRTAARLLLLDPPSALYSPITAPGLPPPSAHQLLQPLLSSFIFPFPALLPPLYFAVSNLVSCGRAVDKHFLLFPDGCAECDTLNNVKVTKFAMDLSKLWDEMLSSKNEQLIDILVPFIKELFEDHQTSRLSVLLLLDKVARGLGPVRTNQLLLDTVLKLYEHSDAWQLYHKHLLLVLLVRCGLKAFLDNLVAPLVETVGRYRETITAKTDIDALDSDLELALSPLEEDLSPEEHNQVTAPSKVSTLPEVAVFTFDAEDVQASEGYDSGDLGEEGGVEGRERAETSDMEGWSQEEEHRREGKGVKSPDIAIPKMNLNQRLTTIECEVGSRSDSLQSEVVDPANKEHNSTTTMTDCDTSHDLSPTDLKTCDVAAESIVWLCHRLGPVLTSRHIARNLLRMLSLCYTGQENLEPAGWQPEGLARLSVCRWRVAGDDNAESVARVLCAVVEIYSEQIILLQYLPFMSELIGLSKRKFTVSLEGGVIACLALLQHVVSLLNDATLMDQLQDVILKNIIHPVVRLASSTRLVFPSGYNGRYTLVTKLVDALYFISVRIGAEMTRAHLAVPSLQRFFLAFDKAHGVKRSNLMEGTKRDSPLRSLDEVTKADIATESTVRSAVGIVLKNEQLDWSSSPPMPSGGEGRGKPGPEAESELKSVFGPELAHRSYLTFAKFLGNTTMESTVKNHDLVQDLCFQYEAVQSVHLQPGTNCHLHQWGDYLNAQEDVPERGGSGSFGSNVAVIGNKIELQSVDASCLEPQVSGAVSEDTMALVSRKMADTTRHLRGNWLAYWEHEIGRSDKDNKFNFKQMKLMTYTGHTNSVRMVSCLDNESSFMTGSKDKTVKLWSLRSQGDGSATSSFHFSYNQHRKSLLSLSFVSSLRVVASCDSTIHIWDPFIGKTLSVLDSSRVPPVNILREVTPPSCSLVAGTTDSTLRIVDARLCAYVCEYKVSWSPMGLIRSLCVSPSGAWVAVGQSSGMVTVLDLRTGMVLASWKGHDGEVLQLAAVSESLLLSSSLDQTISVWSVADGKFKFHMKGPTEPVHCLSILNNELITCTTANRIGVHTSLDSQSCFSSTKLRSDAFKGVLTAMTMLPLNKLLLLGGDNGAVTLLC